MRFSLFQKIMIVLVGTVWCLIGPASGQSLVISASMQFDYAQKNFNEKDFQTALVEFKRFIHFFPGDERVLQARFRTGRCLYQLKRFKEAAKVFNAVILDQGAGVLRDKSVLYQSRSFQNMGNEGYAKITLINYLKLTRDSQVKDQLHSALADLFVASFKGGDRQDLIQAAKNLDLISEAGALRYRRDERLRAIDAALLAPEKNPALAGVLSILPGAGFFYCERYQDALVAFLLNAGLILAAYNAFDDDHVALGSVIAFVETGFYSGNIYGAVTAAHRWNRDTKINILGKKFEIFTGASVDDKAWMIGLKTRF